MSPETGRPKIVVRIEQDVIDELHRLAGESPTGRAGGLALFVRRIIYEYLGWPMPLQFGDLGRSSRNRKPKESRQDDQVASSGRSLREKSRRGRAGTKRRG